jgi:hypothetical protein
VKPEVWLVVTVLLLLAVYAVALGGDRLPAEAWGGVAVVCFALVCLVFGTDVEPE